MKRKKKENLNGGGPESNGLKDLDSKMITPPETSVDNLPELVDMAATEEQDKKLEASADKANEWVTTRMVWLADYESSSQAKRDRFADTANEYRKTLAGLLNHENTTIRRAAWLALFLFKFGQTYTSHAEVASLLANMVRDKKLVETTDDGSISAQRKQYNFSLDACFEEKHVLEIQQAFRAMLTRVWAAVREGWKVKREELARLATISLDDLVAGKAGVCVIDVPSQQTKGDEDEKSVRLEGGRLVVHSDGEKITIVDVVNEVHGWGNFEWSVRDAKNLRPPIFLKVESLSWDKPPFIKEMPEHGRKARMLWFAIKRAIDNAEIEKINDDEQANDTTAGDNEATHENSDANVAAS